MDSTIKVIFHHNYHSTRIGASMAGDKRSTPFIFSLNHCLRRRVCFLQECYICIAFSTTTTSEYYSSFFKLLTSLKAQANGFNICFNIRSILLNAVEGLLTDVELRDGKRFQHFIQQNFASGLVSSSGPRSTRETHARAPF